MPPPFLRQTGLGLAALVLALAMTGVACGAETFWPTRTGIPGRGRFLPAGVDRRR